MFPSYHMYPIYSLSDCGHMPAAWGVPDAGSLLTATPTKAVKYVAFFLMQTKDVFIRK
jgi:hypothetical protein